MQHVPVPAPNAFKSLPKLPSFIWRVSLIAVAGALMLTLFAKFEELSYQNYVRDLKIDATVDLVDARETIETGLIERILDFKELSVMLGQDPEINLAHFNIKALDFVLNNPEARAIALSPGGVVDRVFPRYGNEGLVGTNLIEEAQSERLERAIAAGEGYVTGPIERADGTLALVLHSPVESRTDDGKRHIWGTLSVALDYETFLTNIGFDDLNQRFDLLIREMPSLTDRNPAAIIGDPNVLAHDPIFLEFNFPFGRWQLAATPNGGWPARQPDFVARMVQGAIVILSILTALWYVTRLFERRREAEKILSNGIEALDHGFVMFDAERRLVAFNEKYKQLAGGSGMVRVGNRYEDIVKANLENGLIPDAVGREEEWYENWATRLDGDVADNEQILADGRLIRAYDRPMEDGSVVGLRIDITDLKKAQIAAEAANEAKTEFMGVLSHELRTPLTVILGHAQLAKNIKSMPVFKNLRAGIEEQGGDTEKALAQADALAAQIATMMGSLERSGNHLFTLISEILDFAKIDSGTLSMDMQPVTAEEIAQPIVDQMLPMAEEKGLKLELSAAPHALVADSQRIQQILINLIGNATKFTDEGKISVKVDQDEDFVSFAVTDTGIGIPKEHLTRVFEAFHQVDSSSGRKYGGTGLGLAISSDIARAHGGELSATSVPGQGCTFTLRLPRPHHPASPKAVTEDAPAEEATAAPEPEQMVA